MSPSRVVYASHPGNPEKPAGKYSRPRRSLSNTTFTRRSRNCHPLALGRSRQLNETERPQSSFSPNSSTVLDSRSYRRIVTRWAMPIHSSRLWMFFTYPLVVKPGRDILFNRILHLLLNELPDIHAENSRSTSRAGVKVLRHSRSHWSVSW